MDLEDAIYLTASALIGIGIGFLSVGAGIASFGFALIIPPMVGLFRGKRGNK
jgi:hypothetical protein